MNFNRFSGKEDNMFDKVLDFNWHKKTASPNFVVGNQVDPFIEKKEFENVDLDSFLLKYLYDLS